MYIIVLTCNFQPPGYVVDIKDYYFTSDVTEATEFRANIIDHIVERYAALHPEYNFSKRECSK